MSEDGTRMVLTPAPERPELAALIEKARERWLAMTPAERAVEYRAQIRSFTIGQIGMMHPELDRETIEARVDAALEAYGR